MMKKLHYADLLPLGQYIAIRDDFRAQVMTHKKDRRLPLGEHAALYFEDALTIRYQVQEMLRIERITEEEEISQELAAYNPLIPDGQNWKATFMIEYDEKAARQAALARMLGIEHCVWIQAGSNDPIHPIANEDLARSTEDKTSAVHFLRFELSVDDVTILQQGAILSAGIDHDHYCCKVPKVPDRIRESLIRDLQLCSES